MPLYYHKRFNKKPEMVGDIGLTFDFNELIRQSKKPYLGQSFLLWWSHRESVTFRDPETSRLKTQFSSEGFLENCRLAVLTRIVSDNPDSIRRVIHQIKNATEVTFLIWWSHRESNPDCQDENLVS